MDTRNNIVTGVMNAEERKTEVGMYPGIVSITACIVTQKVAVPVVH